jgi:desulfoferrodoxin (superoxide reductase-like protein)
MNQKAVTGSENEDDDTIVTEDEGQSTEQNTSEYQSTGDQGNDQSIKDDEGDSDEVIVSIGEDAPPPEEQTHAPEWVRELRKTNRELQRQNRELQGKLQSTAQTETKPVLLGKKPSLEEHDYDAEKFETALTDWFDRKRQADDSNAKQQAEVMTQQKAWQAKLDDYGKAKAELRVKDFEDAEAIAQELFSVTQQGVVLQGADNPALVIYALGKNPKKAKELSDIKDPVKFAFAVAKLETQLKVSSKKAPSTPEKMISGSGRSSGSVDNTLERLRTDAAKSGDFSKVTAYKRQKKAS